MRLIGSTTFVLVLAVACTGAELSPADTALAQQAPPASAAPTPSPEPSVKPPPAIPAPFHGRWAPSEAACKTAKETPFSIAPDVVNFYESHGKVQAIETTSDKDIKVTFAMTGEGDSWTKQNHLVLSENGANLTLDGRANVRCPGP